MPTMKHRTSRTKGEQHITPPPSPSVLTDLTATFGRVYDRCPRELSVIQSFVTERLHRNHRSQIAEASTDVERHNLVGAVFNDIFPAAMASGKCKKAVRTMLVEYAKLPSTPATQLKGTPGANSLLAAIGFGLIAGSVIVGVICLAIMASEV